MKTQNPFHRIFSITMAIIMLLTLALSTHQAPRFASSHALAAPNEDTVAPSTIANLSAHTGDAPGEVALSWFAPGDDATAGVAASYIVRYYNAPITDENWASASDVSGEPTPQPAGSAEGMVVTGLLPGQYYFAIRAQDEAANLSTVSNSPQATASTSHEIYLPLALNAGPPAIIPDTTEVLPETTTQHLVSISGDGSVFTFSQSTPALEDLQPGDVMVSAATASAPYGFLRLVTSVTMVGDQVIVTSADATLGDAVQTGSGHISQVLSLDQIQDSLQAPGVSRVMEAESLPQQYLELRDVVLYDVDGDPETEDDQIKANGSIHIQPSFELYIQFHDGELTEFSCSASEVKTVALEISAAVELELLDLEKEVAQYTYQPFLMMIGWVPVEVVPVLSLYVGVDGSVHAGVSTKVEHQAVTDAYVYLEDGDFHPGGSHSEEYYFTPPHLTNGLDLKGYAGAQLSLLLYGVAGPYANLDAYLKLEADVLEDPWWKLYGGVELSVGVKVDFLGDTLYDYAAPVFLGYRLLLAEAESNTPPELPYNPTPTNAALVQDLDTNLHWYNGDFENDVVTFDVYFEQGDSTPDVLVADNLEFYDYDPGPLSANSLYYWRVIAQDEHGATTVGPVWSFQTANGATCPIALTLQPPRVVDRSVTVDGSVSSDCSTITRLHWQWGDGLGEDRLFPARHTYAKTGIYPITVTAYNDLGESEVAVTIARVGVSTDIMIFIPAGEFQMGCSWSIGDCATDELPLHTVYLDAYYIGQHEVTNAEYAQCVAAGACSAPQRDYSGSRYSYYGNPSYSDYPVIFVGWDQASAYCAWAGRRLPTEAEWEKAARGTSVITYPWGDQSPNCTLVGYGLCVYDTTMVGSYPLGASPYGVMDMAGNVFEWVNDWYDSGYYSGSPYANPLGPETGTYRVIRGSSFLTLSDNDLNVARRSYNNPSNGDYDVGFRCAASAP